MTARPLPCPSPLPFTNAALQPIPTDGGECGGGGGGGGGGCDGTGGTGGGTGGGPCADEIVYSLPSPGNPYALRAYYPPCTDSPCSELPCPTEPGGPL